MKIIKYIGVMAMLVALAWAADSRAFFGFDKYESVSADQGMVTIPVADMSDGEAHYYKYETAGRVVKFFLLKSSDGVIRAAFDACDVCYLEKKGYSQDGDFMVCNNCGQRFHSSRINEVQGGCNPSPLSRIDDGSVVSIMESSIIAGSKYF
ncbi:DUF2318 domain-containing protein [Pseudodesulfovibrio sediminis]|uniref:Membrane protein n=1 Tax=Pseudodesulfovibrio sediminis TaxID=2810563 RepID=A0ABN6EW99_9BACT|nr:DUF2318 domain-containing protein [Pseudodesulfovibrio sediminis]BCS89444.1 membrane protein [Pseudodesulfovibrio sediminis]